MVQNGDWLRAKHPQAWRRRVRAKCLSPFLNHAQIRPIASLKGYTSLVNRLRTTEFIPFLKTGRNLFRSGEKIGNGMNSFLLTIPASLSDIAPYLFPHPMLGFMGIA